MKKGFLIFPVLVLAACSNSIKSKKIVWEGSGEPPHISVSNAQSQLNVSSSGEEITVQKQFVSGVPVEGTYIKNIYKKNSHQLKYINANYYQSFDKKVSQDVIELKKYSNAQLWNLLFAQHPALRDRRKIEEPKISVILQNNVLVPVIKFTFFRTNLESLETWVFDSHLNFLFTEESSSHFADMKALAYPDSPKTTQISTVILNSIKSEINLLSDQIQVNTESPNKVTVGELLQDTNNDEKFDQVQAFYYIQKAITWFENQMIIGAGQLKVQAQLHIGYPEKTNAAFYYGGIIRLGSGDDVVFSRIALDPSIVMHETGHALVEMLASLPYQDEGGSLNEGFADFYTCIQLNNPKLGEVAYKKAAFKRQIDKLVKISEKNGGLYHDSAIVSSILWALKEKLGAEKAVMLATETLKRLTPASKIEDFRVELNKQMSDKLADDELKEAQGLIKSWES